MGEWWDSGYQYAKAKNKELMSEFRPDILTDQEIEKSTTSLPETTAESGQLR
jgi:hypothetical protein